MWWIQDMDSNPLLKHTQVVLIFILIPTNVQLYNANNLFPISLSPLAFHQQQQQLVQALGLQFHKPKPSSVGPKLTSGYAFDVYQLQEHQVLSAPSAKWLNDGIGPNYHAQ